jgi:hypothetical protein
MFNNNNMIALCTFMICITGLSNKMKPKNTTLLEQSQYLIEIAWKETQSIPLAHK